MLCYDKIENKKDATISDLIGKTIIAIEKSDDQIIFRTDGISYIMFHNQGCCESVTIESIVGDLDDLIDKPILLAEERTEEGKSDSEYKSSTWSFYTLATIKGYVDIRWYGESNGYYSESVDFASFV